MHQVRFALCSVVQYVDRHFAKHNRAVEDWEAMMREDQFLKGEAAMRSREQKYHFAYDLCDPPLFSECYFVLLQNHREPARNRL